MRALVHVGFHKTGTTFLQSLLSQAREELVASRGLLYVTSHKITNSLLREQYWKLESLVESAGQLNCGTLLLSSETFEGMVASPKLAVSFEHELRRLGIDEVDWIICIRRQDEYF